MVDQLTITKLARDNYISIYIKEHEVLRESLCNDGTCNILIGTKWEGLGINEMD